MTSYVVLPSDLSRDLETTLLLMHNQLKTHRHPSVDKLGAIMERIKEENKNIEEIKITSHSCWNQTWCIRMLSGSAILAGIIAGTVSIIDFSQAQGEVVKCIKELDDFHCFNSTEAILNVCEKDASLDWTKFIGGIIATVLFSIKAYGDEKRSGTDKKQQEILNKIQGREQTEMFQRFIGALSEFKTHKDSDHFKNCIKQMGQLKENGNHFLPKMGSEELIASFLIEKLDDKGLNEKINEVKKRANSPRRTTKRRKRIGEGASSSTQNSLRDIWAEIEKTVGIPLRYLKIGDQYISSDGRTGESESDLLDYQEEMPKPVLDITSSPTHIAIDIKE